MISQRKSQLAQDAAQFKSHEQLRKELWIGVAVSVARAENARSNSVPGNWANKALEEFDKRFPK